MKIAVLGSGLVGAPMAMDLANEFEVSIIDKNEKQFEKIDNEFPIEKICCDLSKKNILVETISDFDLVLNALPGFLGYQTTKTVIEQGKNIVDISFFPEDPNDLKKLALQKDVTAIIDCGVAPGMSYLLVGYLDQLLDETENIEIYVGGLPKIRTKPFEYKAVFSPIDVIEEYTRPARFVRKGSIVTKEALTDLELMDFEGFGTLESFNSDGLRSLIKNIDCPNMIEKTLRYPGHVEKVKLLRDIGFFNYDTVKIGDQEIRPIDLSSKLLFPMWELKQKEEDITIMKIIVSGIKDGNNIRYTYDLLDEYDKETGVHSMARTTGYTATVAVRMLNQKVFTDKGLIYPEMIGKHPACVEFMINGLKDRKVNYEFTKEIID